MATLAVLDDALTRCAYKNWQFRRRGLDHVYATIHVNDSTTDEPIDLTWRFPIPNLSGWVWEDVVGWVFAQVVHIETHEAAERFQVGDRRPFWPDHQVIPAGTPQPTKMSDTNGVETVGV